jgi:RsiW-degrading membrane proteinase PrsW (M82 family)
MEFGPFSDFGFNDYHTIFLIYLSGLLGSVIVGNAMLIAAGINGGTDAYLVFSPLLAGFTEPILSKWVPALGVLYWLRTRRILLIEQVRSHPFMIGAYGGACIGIVEAIGKVVWPYGMYSSVDGITIGVVLAAVSHVLYGGIIGNATYRNKTEKPWQKPVTAILLVILFHFSWNAWKVLQLLPE